MIGLWHRQLYGCAIPISKVTTKYPRRIETATDSVRMDALCHFGKSVKVL